MLGAPAGCPRFPSAFWTLTWETVGGIATVEVRPSLLVTLCVIGPHKSRVPAQPRFLTNEACGVLPPRFVTTKNAAVHLSPISVITVLSPNSRLSYR